jgi:uncharacterized protein (TIGR00730 family)
MKNRNQQPIIKSDIHEGSINGHIELISKEFRHGFDFVKKYPKSVSIFGSSRLKPGSVHYNEAEKLATKIVRELGYAVVTGGGPGIMEAGNKGAMESGGASLGLLISLPFEHSSNEYLSDSMRFTYFFSRKAMLMFAAEAYVFFPGGYGTMDEFFSVITLIQTGKLPKVPIILFGGEYWHNFKKFLKENMVDEHQTINPEDLDLFEITDSHERALEIIQKAPVSEWWRNIN